MHNPIEIIDTNAAIIARSLDVMVYSLEGLYEKMARDNPTMHGVSEFWLLASKVADQAVANTLNQMSVAHESLYASLSDSERSHFDEQSDYANDVEIAQGAFGAFFTQAKIAYANRLRAIVAARAFNMDTYNADPKIMTRNGRRWNFSDYAYLTARQLMVDWYNGIKIDYLSNIGATEFTLLTDDPELIYATYKVEDYPHIAADLFHPRTSKLVGSAYVST